MKASVGEPLRGMAFAIFIKTGQNDRVRLDTDRKLVYHYGGRDGQTLYVDVYN